MRIPVPDRGSAAAAVWITWESQRRNRELAAALGIVLLEWADIDRMAGRMTKYATGLRRTIATIVRGRPRLVVCQNPSIVLAACAIFLRWPTGAIVVVDAHNAGLRPMEGRSRVLNRVARWLQCRADLTLVSNAGLAEAVRGNGGKPFILPDRIPRFSPDIERVSRDRPFILFVCTFASDEPFETVFEAAREVPFADVLVTGNYRKKSIDPDGGPSNLRLTGFVSEEEYLRLLSSADVVMDLTDREDCLVCGAYEALAMGKPMILSDTRVNREYFSSGVVYSQHTVVALANAMTEALARREELAEEAAALREQREREWNGRLEDLKVRLRAMAGAGVC